MTNVKEIKNVQQPKSIIWHYDIPIMDIVTVVLPIGSIIFDLMLHEGKIKLFVCCNEDNPPEEREIRILSDGMYFISETLDYIGSVTLLDGNLIYHVFEDLKEEEEHEQKEKEA